LSVEVLVDGFHVFDSLIPTAMFICATSISGTP
jgi:hypothetical protein